MGSHDDKSALTGYFAVPANGDLEARTDANREDDEHSCGHEHFSHRSPWLRAALLGANDGLVSCASLMVGVGAVRTEIKYMIISGLSGLVAGACSIAIGEFVSVYGQRDTEEADLQKEREEHARGPSAREHELEELTQIYVERGLTYRLAREVAEELSKIDPIRAHARDELGIDIDDLSNPSQAAVVSGIAFSIGGVIPLLSAIFVEDYNIRLAVLIFVSSCAFACFGALGAYLGGAKLLKAAARGTFGGWMAMLVTYVVLSVFGTTGSL